MRQEGLNIGRRERKTVNPLPEITPEIVRSHISGAFYDITMVDETVFGPMAPRLFVGGCVVDGMLIAAFTQMCNLKDPTLAELVSKADMYVEHSGQQTVV